jgi:nicotinamide-nucleotide amidase
VGCLRIELITIGDELLLGFTIDTNAAHLARELAGVGVEIVRRTTVGDAGSAIAAAVRDALDRTGAVVTTGGLGPTSDDLTKPAIAALFQRSLHLDNDILARLEQRWRTYGRSGPLPAANRQQALIPDRAVVLDNHHGSAPGIWLEDEQQRWVAMLPGVPREMRGMLADQLLPRIRARTADPGGSVVRSRTLRTTGIAESALADRLGALADGVGGLPLAYLPGVDGVDLRLTARGVPADVADQLLADGIAQLRQSVGRFAYGEGTADLAAIVLAECRARRQRIAVGESCTGGLLGARITAVPGSSDVFVGGVIAYDNEVKETLLGVPAETLRTLGAVSESVAGALASGARARTGADIGVGVTGIAGPGGGSPDKPVGTVWVALAAAAGDAQESVHAVRTIFMGDRDENRQRAAQLALDMIRRHLTDDSRRT